MTETPAGFYLKYLAAKLPFTLGFWTAAAAQAQGPAAVGFSMDYTLVSGYLGVNTN